MTDDSAARINSLRSTFKNHCNDDDWFAAADCGRQLLELLIATYGPRHEQVAGGWNNLAIALDRSAQLDGAEDAYRTSANILESDANANPSQTVDALNNLARFYFQQNRYDESAETYRRLLVALRSAHGDDHPMVAVFLNNMGLMYQNQGMLREASVSYAEAMEVANAAAGKTWNGVRQHEIIMLKSRLWANISSLSRDFGRYDEALQYQEMSEQLTLEAIDNFDV